MYVFIVFAMSVGTQQYVEHISYGEIKSFFKKKRKGLQYDISVEAPELELWKVYCHYS